MNLGGPELLILVGLAVLIFGAGWLPKAAKNLGKAKVEFDEVQRQFNETKNSVVEAAGVKELESTMRKANKVINTSPQKLMKDAAKSAVTGSGTTAAAKTAAAAEAASADTSVAETDESANDFIEDAEIVDPTAQVPNLPAPADSVAPNNAIENDDNINLDFR